MLDEVKKYNKNFFSVSNLKAFLVIILSILIIFPYFGIIYNVIRNSTYKRNFFKDVYADGFVGLFKKGVLFFLFSLVVSLVSSLIFFVVSIPTVILVVVFGLEALSINTAIGIILISIITAISFISLIIMWLYFGAAVLSYCRDGEDFFSALFSKNNIKYIKNSKYHMGILSYIFFSQIIAGVLFAIPFVYIVFGLIYPLLLSYSIGYVPLFLSERQSSNNGSNDGTEKVVRSKWKDKREDRSELWGLIE